MNDIEALNLFNELSGITFNGVIPDSQKKSIEQLYKYCFGKHLRRCNCKNIYSDAFIELTLYYKKTGKMKDNRKYKLKRGVVIQLQGTTDVYTCDNITDDVAREYLKSFPQMAKLFERIPKNDSKEAKKDGTQNG